MSQHERSTEETWPFTEAEIASYLHESPDFFERHPALLLHMSMPHAAGSAAVSLVERQVSMLRQRNAELKRQLRELVDIAEDNDALVTNIIRLGVSLIRAPDTSARLARLKSSLREDLSAEHAALVLFEPGAEPPASRSGFVLRIDRDNAALEPFSAFLRAARPRCGPLTAEQRKLVFRVSVKSAALVPLGAGAGLGFLVIGSKDPDYFHPAKRTDYLGRLGDLVGAAIESGQPDSDGHRET